MTVEAGPEERQGLSDIHAWIDESPTWIIDVRNGIPDGLEEPVTCFDQLVLGPCVLRHVDPGVVVASHTCSAGTMRLGIPNIILRLAQKRSIGSIIRNVE